MLRSVAALSGGEGRTKLLHQARIELRRLQALLELVGEAEGAARIADCVSTLSPLRTLQVMEKYLARLGSPKRDRRGIAGRASRTLEKLRRKEVFPAIEQVVREVTARLVAQSHDWMAARFRQLRQEHGTALSARLAAITDTPGRRALHALRLEIKAIRYQEELALRSPFGKPEVVEQLKAAQTLLGEYEERAEFRKLARRLELTCQKRIKKDWRRARKHARRVPQMLADIPQALTDERLLFLRPGSRRRLGAR